MYSVQYSLYSLCRNCPGGAKANRRQKLGLVWRNRKKIIKDYFNLPFFLLIILCGRSSKGIFILLHFPFQLKALYRKIRFLFKFSQKFNIMYFLREQARLSQNCHQIRILTGQKFAVFSIIVWVKKSVSSPF